LIVTKRTKETQNIKEAFKKKKMVANLFLRCLTWTMAIVCVTSFQTRPQTSLQRG